MADELVVVVAVVAVPMAVAVLGSRSGPCKVFSWRVTRSATICLATEAALKRLLHRVGAKVSIEVFAAFEGFGAAGARERPLVAVDASGRRCHSEGNFDNKSRYWKGGK